MNTRVAIAGDWHINTDWAVRTLESIADAGVSTVYHVGDFGFWPGQYGQDYLDAVDATLERLGQTLLVTMGNHDDYVFADSLVPAEDGTLPVTDRISIASRGHRWSVDGVSFVSLGGAASINFQDLTEGIDWWRQEAITYGDVMRTVAGGQADVMIAHDAPNGVPALSVNSKNDNSKLSVEALQYAAESRYMMTHAVDGVRPKVFFHGHYHKAYINDAVLGVPGDTYNVRSVGLAKDKDANNVAILDVSDLSVRFL